MKLAWSDYASKHSVSSIQDRSVKKNDHGGVPKRVPTDHGRPSSEPGLEFPVTQPQDHRESLNCQLRYESDQDFVHCHNQLSGTIFARKRHTFINLVHCTVRCVSEDATRKCSDPHRITGFETPTLRNPWTIIPGNAPTYLLQFSLSEPLFFAVGSVSIP